MLTFTLLCVLNWKLLPNLFTNVQPISKRCFSLSLFFQMSKDWFFRFPPWNQNLYIYKNIKYNSLIVKLEKSSTWRHVRIFPHFTVENMIWSEISFYGITSKGKCEAGCVSLNIDCSYYFTVVLVLFLFQLPFHLMNWNQNVYYFMERVWVLGWKEIFLSLFSHSNKRSCGFVVWIQPYFCDWFHVLFSTSFIRIWGFYLPLQLFKLIYNCHVFSHTFNVECYSCSFDYNFTIQIHDDDVTTLKPLTFK